VMAASHRSSSGEEVQIKERHMSHSPRGEETTAVGG